jgi:predicted enzyme related to lactoylglutathione lyase
MSRDVFTYYQERIAMPRVIHFEIHADNPERGVAFYQKVFDWEFTKWTGPQDYWLIKTGPDGKPGINGGLLQRRGAGPVEMQAVNSYVCTIDVPSVDEYVGKVIGAGGTIALPKMAIPGVGWLAYFKDTEGNVVGIMQSDAAAK